MSAMHIACLRRLLAGSGRRAVGPLTRQVQSGGPAAVAVASNDHDAGAAAVGVGGAAEGRRVSGGGGAHPLRRCPPRRHLRLLLLLLLGDLAAGAGCTDACRGEEQRGGSGDECQRRRQQ